MSAQTSDLRSNSVLRLEGEFTLNNQPTIMSHQKPSRKIEREKLATMETDKTG
jgi:hypothetical protein